MGTYEDLKAAIAQVIKQNGNNEIIGNLLQSTLVSMVSNIGANATFAGIATPATVPGTPDQNVFYLASQAGNYPNFNNATVGNSVGLLVNKNNVWEFYDTGIATTQQMQILLSDINVIIIKEGEFNSPYVKAGNGFWDGTPGNPIFVNTSVPTFSYMDTIPYNGGSVEVTGFPQTTGQILCVYADANNNWIGRQNGFANSGTNIFTPPEMCKRIGFCINITDFSNTNIKIQSITINPNTISELPDKVVSMNNLDDDLQSDLADNYAGRFTPNYTTSTSTNGRLIGNANIFIGNLTDVEFYATAGSIDLYVLIKNNTNFVFHSKHTIDTVTGLNVVNLNYGVGDWAICFVQTGTALLCYSAGANATGMYIMQNMALPSDINTLSIPETSINGTIGATVNYNYVYRIHTGNYLDKFTQYNSDIFRRELIDSLTNPVGDLNVNIAPSNPFNSMYVFAKDFQGDIEGFQFRASVAGNIEIILLVKNGAIYNATILPYTVVAGINTFNYSLPNFNGRMAVRCRTGKFYYSNSYPSSILSSVIIPTANPTPTTFAASEIEAGKLAGWQLSVIPLISAKSYENILVNRVNGMEKDIEDLKEQSDGLAIMRKKFMALGDSITAISHGNTYAERVATAMEASEYTNVALGGATWAWRAGTTPTDNPVASNDTNVMSNQVLKVQTMFNNGQITAPDFIILSAGINDVSRNHAIGDIATEYAKPLADVDMYTVIGSIRWCVQTLMQIFPDVRIFLLTPLHTSVAARTFEVMKPYRQAIIDSGVRLSVPIIDCTADCLINEINQSRYMQADLLHPNTVGQNVQFRFVWNRLKTFYYDMQ